MTNTNNLDRPQFGSLQTCKTIGVEDRISELPNEVLSYILTMLTLKEAIATSILSRRWKKLWVTYPNLDFGCFDPCEKETFVQRVDDILGQFNGPKLHKLRVVYPINSEYVGSRIDDWISFAIRNGVSELELGFRGSVWEDNYSISAHVFDGEEKMMNSKHCASSLLTTSPNVGKHYASLRVLYLRRVNISDHVFDTILSSCFSLERFLLMHSFGLVNAKNSAPHLKLKSLELYVCLDLELLQLLAPNLVSFKYQGSGDTTLCIKDDHQLASLMLSTHVVRKRRKNNFISQFSSYLPRLEYFVGTVTLFEGMTDFTELGVFNNLKHLALDVFAPSWVRLGYRVAASVIRAAPYLELLEISLPLVNPAKFCEIQALELASMSPHHKLKQVNLNGFRGDEITMEFLSYLVEYAVSLQKIDISASGVRRHGDILLTRGYLEFKAANEPEDAKNCIQSVMQLRQSLCENVQLLFHEYEQCLQCVCHDQ